MGGRTAVCGYGTSFHAKRWLALDPMGFFGISLSAGIHLFALAVIAAKLISNSLVSTFIYIILYIPVTFLALASLYMAATTDPGAVPLGARPLVTVRRATSSASAPPLQPSLSKALAPAGDGNDQETTNGIASPTALTATTNHSSSSGSQQPQRAIRRCHKCHDNYKPPRAHHDSVTDRCIVKFDHYCPWVNNAVGALNHKFFCLFLFYTAAACVLSLALVMLRVIHCGTPANVLHEEEQAENQPASSIYLTEEANNLTSGTSLTGEEEEEEDPNIRKQRWLVSWTLAAKIATKQATAAAAIQQEECYHFYDSRAVLGLILASLVFLVFCCAMGCEQLETIKSGRGKIARMKMRVGAKGTEFARVTEQFNEMFGGTTAAVTWHWFWPFRPVKFPRGMEKVVLGYEWDETIPSVPYEQDQPYDTNGRHDVLDDVENGRNSYHSQELTEFRTIPLTEPACPQAERTSILLSRTSSDVSSSSSAAAAAAAPGSGGGRRRVAASMNGGASKLRDDLSRVGPHVV